VTDDASDRQGGAWIGQHPDQNTEEIREELDDGAERIAVTNNESGAVPEDGDWPHGHREGEPASDDTIRDGGHSR
jgi:hypothetical protein